MRKICFESPGELRFADGRGVALSVHVARGFVDRFLGLMGQPTIPSRAAMAFPRCTSIHMFHMKTAIDAIWVARPDEDGVAPVLRVDRCLKPGAIAFGPAGSWGVVELSPGTVGEDDEATALESQMLSSR